MDKLIWPKDQLDKREQWLDYVHNVIRPQAVRNTYLAMLTDRPPEFPNLLSLAVDQ